MIKKFLKIIIICLILIIALIFIFKSKSKISFDDTLFLKLFQSSQEKSNDNSKQNVINDYYEFNVDSKTEKIQLVNLYSTTDNLIKEKIAPGTKGEFYVGLKTNKKSQYKIYFISKNNKPINLKFEALENDNLICQANTLEELSNNLKGTVQKNELKIIKIKWCWEYESQGQQDTKDSKIEKYEFEIHVEGEEKR